MDTDEHSRTFIGTHLLGEAWWRGHMDHLDRHWISRRRLAEGVEQLLEERSGESEAVEDIDLDHSSLHHDDFIERLPTAIRKSGELSESLQCGGPRPQQFTGKERDAETGLDYFGARYLSSAQGRWTSPDAPFADQHLEEPQSWNMYGYVRNNPLRYFDPNGRDAQQTFNAAEMKSIQRDMKFVVEHPVLTASVIAGAAIAPEAGGLFSSIRAVVTAAFGWMLGHPQQVQEAAAGIAEGLSSAPPGSLTNGFARLGATTAESVERKLSQYLLNPDHAVGGDKARWFQQALGFTKDNMADLAKQIVFDPKNAVQTVVTEYGTKYNQTIAITGANGKTINVVTGWIRNSDDVVRLVTAVPGK